MPVSTTYQYAVSTDTANGLIDLNRLTAEIQQSSIATAIESLSTTGDTLSVIFKDVLSAADKITLDNNVSPPAIGSLIRDHSGALLEDTASVSLAHKLTKDNRLRVAIEKSDGTGSDFYSHNWADKTSWYTGAARIVDEVATDSGDLLSYILANSGIIDTHHGKITNEDALLDPGGNSYRVVVKVNDVTKTEQDPHVAAGGDYTIEYTAGIVTFLTALEGTDEVKVTYHYAQTSVFKIVPKPGNKLSIEVVEVQFSDDIVITDTVSFITYGFVEAFAPSLVNNPYPAGTKIPINTFKYKTMKDYQNAAFKSYATYPALGGLGWRGMAKPVVVFDWDYQRGLSLHSSKGMESHLLLEHDTPFQGSWATATIYCGEDAE